MCKLCHQLNSTKDCDIVEPISCTCTRCHSFTNHYVDFCDVCNHNLVD